MRPLRAKDKALTRQPDSQKRLHGILAGAAIVFLAIIAYIPAFHAGFIWDDDKYVTNNPLLWETGGLWKIWFSAHFQSQYFPLVYTTLRAEYALWGLNPYGYHVVNILLHGANAVLLWILLRRLSIPGAWLAAAIFAVHPVEVESVAWVTELKNTESTLFYFAALLAWVRFVRSEDKDGWWFYALALVCQALALFSKTTACTLPAGLVLICYIRKEPFGWKRALQITPFVLIGIAMGLVSIWWEKHLGNYAEELGLSFSLLQRTLIASRALWFYFTKLLLPVNLAFSYARWQINAHDVLQYFWVVACIALAILLWVKHNQWPRTVIAAIVFFAAALLPLLGFISEYTFRFSFVADHYQYIASAGVIALFAGVLTTFFAKKGVPKNAQVVGIVAILGILTVLTWRQASVYQNLETLWTDTLAKNPESWMAHYNLGLEFAQRGQSSEAMEHFQQAIAYNPRHVKARLNLGNELEKNGREAEAIQRYQEALEMQPDFALAHYDLGTAYAKEEKFADAVEHLRKAVQLNPKFLAAWQNLSLALAKSGKTNEAIAVMNKAADANPDNLQLLYDVAQAQEGTGHLEQAVESYKRALKLSPNNASIFNNLGNVLFRSGKSEEALEYLRRAQSAEPRNPGVCFNLAMMLAQKGDYTEAKNELEKALQLKPDFVQAQQQLQELNARQSNSAHPK